VAGLNGAGLSGVARSVSGGGWLGAEARAQYAAMASLRWQMFRNGLRFRKGAFEAGARTVSYVLYAVMGLGLGLGMGAVAYLLASRGLWRFLPVPLWLVCLLWQLVPVMLASFQEQFDLGILLRFPVRFGSYYLLWVLFGLADISTVLGALCCFGIWVGITIARPELFAWAALSLAIFAAFNILMVRAIFAWIDRWLAQRKTREILGGVFLMLILSMQLLNPALHRHGHSAPLGRNATSEQAQQKFQEYRQTRAQLKARYVPLLEAADAVQKWFPPGLAASALGQADEQQPGPLFRSLGSLAGLGLYVLAAGGVLAKRLRAEYRGENLGVAPSRKRAKQRQTGWILDGSGPIAAVMEKELRALLRTLPLLYAIGAPLVLAILFSAAFLRGGGPAAHVFPMALPISVVYALLGFTQMFYNNLGADGPAIQVYFLSPTPIRTVLLAKNLFHSALFVLVALLAGVMTSLRLGVPNGTMVAATAAWVLFALPSNLAAGNVFSLTMPYRINPGRISRQRGSQANALGSLLIQVLVMGVGAAVFGLCWYFETIWLAVPIFLALAAGAVFAWMRVLRNADAMANQRRDSLIATLMKTE